MGDFEWDEAKRQRNIADRGVDFAKAALIFAGQFVEAEDKRRDYGEIRYRAIGSVEDEHFVVVYTWRSGNRRIISAWKVSERDKGRYQAILSR